jgi:hypothetical protein
MLSDNVMDDNTVKCVFATKRAHHIIALRKPIFINQTNGGNFRQACLSLLNFVEKGRPADCMTHQIFYLPDVAAIWP